MSPFDMAVFALPNSFIIALLPGLSGMVSVAATDFAMLSLVQAIIAADAGLIASTAVIVEAANRCRLCATLRLIQGKTIPQRGCTRQPHRIKFST
jgi:hypothetical protein